MSRIFINKVKIIFKTVFLLDFASYVDVEHSNYTRLRKMGNRFPSPFSHLTNVNELLTSYITNDYSSEPLLKFQCITDDCLQQFFNTYKDRLFYSCKDHRVYAHCQKHWIMVYDSDKNRLTSYRVSKCILSLPTSL